MSSYLGDKIKYELTEYLDDEISKYRFKSQIQEICQSEHGANWFAIFTAIDSLLQNPSKDTQIKLLEVYLEEFPEGNWETRFSSDMIDRAKDNNSG
jgi:hypothetical protein